MNDTIYGQNIKGEIADDKLVLEVDLGVDCGLSKSQKSIIVASTRGCAKIPGNFGLTVNLNVFRRVDKGKQEIGRG